MVEVCLYSPHKRLGQPFWSNELTLTLMVDFQRLIFSFVPIITFIGERSTGSN